MNMKPQKKTNMIYKLLDWNSGENDNSIGIDLASKMHELQFFILPETEQYNKNVWENCAVVLDKKSDAEIAPFLPELFEWLQDMNWPGADRIYNRLLRFQDNYIFTCAYKECEKKAIAENDEIWLMTLRL